MTVDSRKVLIIGGGQAGARAALGLRENGFRGSITLVGGEQHLPYERPVLSKGFLLDAETPPATVCGQPTYDEQEIAVITGKQAVGINRKDSNVVLSDGEVAAYDVLLLTTGSTVRTLSYNGQSAQGVHYLRTIDDARALEKTLGKGCKLAVIGGGFIGLEVAASAAKRGCNVQVLELADRLLPRLGCAQASDYVLTCHREAGIDVRLGTEVEAIDGQVIRLADGSTIEADVIVAGIGVSPETALAQAAGLDVDDGIVTNEFGQTSDPAIYAAGDATRQFSTLYQTHIRQESWQNANVQAECVAKAICGTPEPITEVPWLWSDQGDLNFQMAGYAPACDEVVVRGGEDNAGLALFQIKDGRLVGGVTINRAKDMPLIRRRLGHPDAPLDTEMLKDQTTSLRKILSVRGKR